MNTPRMMHWTCVLALGASACQTQAILSDLALGEAEIGVGRLSSAVDRWRARKRELPTSLQVLVDNDFVTAEQLIDPWSTPYRLGDDGIVCSSGPDKTAGNADDICKAR